MSRFFGSLSYNLHHSDAGLYPSLPIPSWVPHLSNAAGWTFGDQEESWGFRHQITRVLQQQIKINLPEIIVYTTAIARSGGGHEITLISGLHTAPDWSWSWYCTRDAQGSTVVFPVCLTSWNMYQGATWKMKALIGQPIFSWMIPFGQSGLFVFAGPAFCFSINR